MLDKLLPGCRRRSPMLKWCNESALGELVSATSFQDATDRRHAHATSGQLTTLSTTASPA
ncbi:hypothetical protein EPJ93_14380 [Mycobacteroides abscessus subsp. abscessus]|nr:hypothetical protein EPJ93_14380 [Mycobacteroides abscessus subsp. abscessus]